MKRGKMTFEEVQIASLLRNELLKESEVKASPKQKDLESFEYISTSKQPYISPIMTMSEDEILAFVEEFENVRVVDSRNLSTGQGLVVLKACQLAQECDNLDEIDKKIKEMGYSWEIEPFYMPEVKTRISFLLDPDNNEIELIESIN